jgi:alanine racemase
VTAGAVAVVDVEALQHNLKRVRRVVPKARIMAIIKANGYGHGLERVARALTTVKSPVDAFGVARLDEAIFLRECGFTQPITLLEGFLDATELARIMHYRLEVVVHDAYQIDILKSANPTAPVPVWLKIDTGMHRIGFAPEQVSRAWRRLSECPVVMPPIRLMTHLANADDRNDPATMQQLEVFNASIAGFDTDLSVANSAGILGWPQTHADWVRPGIMLYGSSPFNDNVGEQYGLRPAMTFKARILSVRPSKKGDRIGYGGEWQCPQDMPVGVIGVGYGDGYPRHAKAGTPVLIKGNTAPLIGRVSMDMICVDLRNHPGVNIGDEVVLWGDGLPAETVAQHAGTISYQLFCNVTQRVRFIDDDIQG